MSIVFNFRSFDIDLSMTSMTVRTSVILFSNSSCGDITRWVCRAIECLNCVRSLGAISFECLFHLAYFLKNWNNRI